MSSSKITMAREKLLAAAHTVIAERIDDQPPGRNDDAENEYHEEMLVAAAREFADVTKDMMLSTGSDYDRQVLRGPQINGDRI